MIIIVIIDGSSAIETHVAVMVDTMIPRHDLHDDDRTLSFAHWILRYLVNLSLLLIPHLSVFLIYLHHHYHHRYHLWLVD